MISIVLAIILGLGFTFLATQNPGNISINFFDNNFALPIYAFAAICFLVGIAVAMVFNLFDMTVAALDIDKRDNDLKQAIKNNDILRNQVGSLNTQNAKLKQDFSLTQAQLRTEKINHTKQNVKKFFGKIRRSVAH